MGKPGGRESMGPLGTKIEWSNALGWISVERPSENVVVVTMAGRVSGEHSAKVIEGMAGYFEEPRDLFFDLGDLMGYESSARTVMTTWFLNNMRDLRSLHMYATKPLVKMGVYVVKLVVPKLESYESEGDFRQKVVELSNSEKP